MKKYKGLLVVVLVLLSIACNNQPTNTAQALNKTNGTLIANPNVQINTKQSSTENLIDKSIFGIWRLTDDETNTIEITKDSIYYVDLLRHYNYCLKKDSLIIYFDDWTNKNRFKIEGDTLTLNSLNLEGSNEVAVYYRVKD